MSLNQLSQSGLPTLLLPSQIVFTKRSFCPCAGHFSSRWRLHFWLLRFCHCLAGSRFGILQRFACSLRFAKPRDTEWIPRQLARFTFHPSWFHLLLYKNEARMMRVFRRNPTLITVGHPILSWFVSFDLEQSLPHPPWYTLAPAQVLSSRISPLPSSVYSRSGSGAHLRVFTIALFLLWWMELHLRGLILAWLHVFVNLFGASLLWW